MRILIDGTCLAGNLTGIGKTTWYLLQQLLSNPVHDYHLYFNLGTREARKLMQSLELTQAQLFGPKRHYGFFTSDIIDRFLNQRSLRDIDIVHFPNYESHPSAHKEPNVVSVYDLSAEVFPDFFTPPMRDFVQTKGKSAARRATRLLVCSQSTSRDLQQYWGIPADRIDVVYLAPGLNLTQRAEVDGGLPDKFILFVGTLEPRKNVERIIGSFNLLKKEGSSHKLVLIGQKGWLSDGIFKSIEQSPYASDIVWKQYLPEPQLVMAYERADVLLYPSHYEGFGMPVVEAMSLGTPVITSRVSSLPEAAGEAALYVDQNQTDAIFEGLRRVLGDPDERSRMQEKGRQQAAQFSWERTARETLSVYERTFAASARPHAHAS